MENILLFHYFMIYTLMIIQERKKKTTSGGAIDVVSHSAIPNTKEVPEQIRDRAAGNYFWGKVPISTHM